jgi:hypothetical protein
MGDRADVFAVAISYDPVATLARFTQEYDITYDLLSDVGSVEIERLGMLNNTIIEEVGAWGLEYGTRHHRVPFPGAFLLDEAGVVIEKKFDRSHRVRPSGSVLLADLTREELAPAVSGTAAGPGVGVMVWLDEATYFPAQRLYAHVRIVIEEGLHLYVPPLAEGYVPLRVHLEGRPPLIAEAPELPSGKPFRIEGLDETFSVVEGSLDVKIPFYFSDEATEDATLTVRMEYQACSDSVCFAPVQVSIDLPVGYLPIPRP